MEVYGQSHPPEYDVESLKENLKNVKILLFTGERDALIPDDNLERLLDVLPSHVEHIRVEDYNHVDYTWAKDANFYVNLEIRNFLKQL